MSSYTPEVTEIKDGASANRLILRVNPLVNGDAVPTAPARSLGQVTVEGIVGSPEGRSRGRPGDLRVRIDVPQVWQKISGFRTRTGWQLIGSGGLSAIAVQQDGVDVGEQPTLNFTGSVVATDDPVENRIDIDIGAGLQPSLSENNVYRLLPASQGVAPVNLGIPNVSSGGVTHPALASTNLLTSTPRTRWTSLVGAGNTTGHRSNFLLFWRGDAAGVGGFDVIFRFAQTAFAAGHRAFTGLRGATTVIPAIDPSALTDVVGVGYDLGDSQWALIHSDAGGPATVTPLGASFNVSTSDLLELRLQSDPNGSEIAWRLRNLSTGALAFGTLAANIPAATQFLSTNVWANTGSDGTTAAQVEITMIYAEVE